MSFPLWDFEAVLFPLHGHCSSCSFEAVDSSGLLFRLIYPRARNLPIRDAFTTLRLPYNQSRTCLADCGERHTVPAQSRTRLPKILLRCNPTHANPFPNHDSRHQISFRHFSVPFPLVAACPTEFCLPRPFLRVCTRVPAPGLRSLVL